MDYVENWLINKLTLPHYSDYEQEKVKFGVKVIINDLWKALLLYGVSIFLNCFWQTLIVHITFYFLRQVCFGYHFNNPLICLIMSVISLPIGISLLVNIELQRYSILGLYGGLVLIILFLAPVATNKNPLLGLKHKKYLRKKVALRIGILSCIFLFVTVHLQQLMVYGVLILTLSLLMQKFIGGKKMLKRFNNFFLKIYRIM